VSQRERRSERAVLAAYRKVYLGAKPVELLSRRFSVRINAATQRPVMIFDKTCEVKNDPDHELRNVVTEAMS
jgi:hypothetical protein